MKTIGFSILLLILNSAFGISYPFHHDVLDELQKADFVKVPAELYQQWTETLSQETADAETVRAIVDKATGLKTNIHLDAIRSRKIEVKKNVRGDAENLVAIEGEDISLESKHAIQNLAGYLENRVGKFFFKKLQQGKIKSFVLGSKPIYLEKDLVNILPKGEYTVSSVPSLYEKWGLYRYWVQSTRDSQSYYVLVVPPSTQYVRHYATLLDSSGKYASAESYLNLEAQTNFKNRLKALAKEVRTNFGTISVLFFGYEKNWISQIKEPNSPWLLSYSTHVTASLGLNLHLLELKHKQTQKTVRVVSLQPDQTVWGELASFYYEAMLNLSPKVAIFMGSAGSLKENLRPYQVSVPKEFYLHDGTVRMQNWLLSEIGSVLPTDIHSSARHSMTYSPVQQTKKYVQSLVDHNISTVDVEQALVGRMIHEYNAEHKAQILFGAVNVITDQPGNVLFEKANIHNDLDVLNWEEKEKAKNKAVWVALQALDSWVLRTSPVSCKSFFTQPSE